MAADVGTPSEAGTSFEPVSRLRGTVFRYVAMGASWLGIVVLAGLLLRVVVDAFGLTTAGPTWYTVYGVTVIVPLVALTALGLRDRTFGLVALRAVVVPVAGTFFAAALVVLFVVLNPQVLFTYYTTAILPGVLVFLWARRNEDGRAPFFAAGVLVAGGLLGAAVWRAVNTYPVTWTIYLWTLVVPAAALTGALFAERTTTRRASLGAVAVVAGGAVAPFTLPALAGVPAGPAVLLYLAILVPTVGYTGTVLSRRKPGWTGVLAPVVLITGVVLGRLVVDAVGATTPRTWLDWAFLTSATSFSPEQAGLFPAIVGSVFVIALVAVLSFVFGVGAAIYLEEYAPESGLLGASTRVVRINIANLAGVPSVVYGLLGLGLFVNLLGMGIGTVLVAALTLSLLILPIVIISAQEAIRSVPGDLRQASYGMGATRWQTIRNVVLPRAIPGILTGTILSLSRAIGETAPLLMIGAATTVFSPPEGLGSQVSAMPLQVFYWAFAAKSDFRNFVAPAGVVTLLVVLLVMNSVAIYLRNRYQREA